MKKKIICAIAVMLMLVGGNSVFADPIAVTSGAVMGGEAVLTGITGGDVNTTATTCNVNVTGAQGAVATWNSLNVNSGHTLNFNFANSGQYALNKVTSGISEFAGTVNANGGGTVIISNPNGIVATGTSVFNMGSSPLLLTTQDANVVDGVANLTKTGNGTVAIQNGASFVGDSLTVASVGNIDVSGANLASANNIMFVTADGLNYALATKDISDLNNASNTSDITIANTAIQTTDGKIVLNSARDVQITAASKRNNQTLGKFDGEVEVTANRDVTISSTANNTLVPITKGINITAPNGTVTLKNVKTSDNSTTSKINADKVTLQIYDTLNPGSPINYTNCGLSNLLVNSVNDIDILQYAVYGNSTFNSSNGSINVIGSSIGSDSSTSSVFNAANDVVIDRANDVNGDLLRLSALLGNIDVTTNSDLIMTNVNVSRDPVDATLSVSSLQLNNTNLKDTVINDLNSLELNGTSKIVGDVVYNASSYDSPVVQALMSSQQSGALKGNLSVKTPSTVSNSMKTHTDSNTPGTQVAINPGAGEFNVKAFAAADDEDDSADYKEEFLTRYVKEGKDGTLYTDNTFQGK